VNAVLEVAFAQVATQVHRTFLPVGVVASATRELAAPLLPAPQGMPYNEVVSVQARLVLGTLSFFNACILVILGALAVLFVDGRAKLLVALAAWIAAIGLFRLARRLRRDVEWH